MAITISVADANKDGKGIDFAAYLSNYAKTYETQGYGGFNGQTSGDVFDAENPIGAKSYVTSDSETGGGTSVIFNSSSKFVYEFYNGHLISGKLASLVFGTDTTVTEVDPSKTVYSNSGDVTIAGFTGTTSSADGQIMGDLIDADVSSLSAYLQAQSITFKGSTGNDVMTSYANNDRLYGYGGDDTLDGAAGKDWIDGGIGNDTLTGGSGNDTLYGNSGDDTLNGGADSDKLFGNAGADKIDGGAGTDSINGGSGNDRLSGGASNDAIYGGTGNDRITGDGGSDKLYGDQGNDTLSGGIGNDTISGGTGDDSLYGQAGNDRLFGGSGSDRLSGGAGNDYFSGGTGNDILTGGTGADVFFFARNAGADTITDFAAGKTGSDVIQFSDTLFDSFADVLAAATDTDDGVSISYQGGSLLLADIEIADLNKNDFDFV